MSLNHTSVTLDLDLPALLALQGGIKIKRYARVIEGHILDFKPGKRRHS